MRTLTTKRPRVFMRKTKNKTATTATVSRLQLLSPNILPLHLLRSVECRLHCDHIPCSPTGRCTYRPSVTC